MLNGTHQWIKYARMLHLNCLDTFRNRFKIYKAGVISDAEFKVIEDDFNAIISARISKNHLWQLINRQYRCNFYGKDFDKFIEKPKRKRLYPPLSSIHKVKRK